MRNWKVIFSDGRPLEVKASCAQAAKNIAYRWETAHAIVDVVPA